MGDTGNRFGFVLGAQEPNHDPGQLIWRGLGDVPLTALADETLTGARDARFFRVDTRPGDSGPGTNFPHVTLNIAGGGLVDLKPEFETSSGFIWLSYEGGDSLVIPGPAHSSIPVPDDAEVYRYNLGATELAAVIAWTATFEGMSLDVRNTLRVEFRDQTAADHGDLPEDQPFQIAVTTGFPTVAASFDQDEIEHEDITFDVTVTAGYPDVTSVFITRVEQFFVDLGSPRAGDRSDQDIRWRDNSPTLPGGALDSGTSALLSNLRIRRPVFETLGLRATLNVEGTKNDFTPGYETSPNFIRIFVPDSPDFLELIIPGPFVSTNREQGSSDYEIYNWETDFTEFTTQTDFFNRYDLLTDSQRDSTRIVFTSSLHVPILDDIEIVAEATAGFPVVTADFDTILPDDITFSASITAGNPTVSADFRTDEVPDDIIIAASATTGFPTVSSTFVVLQDTFFIDIGAPVESDENRDRDIIVWENQRNVPPHALVTGTQETIRRLSIQRPVSVVHGSSCRLTIGDFRRDLREEYEMNEDFMRIFVPGTSISYTFEGPDYDGSVIEDESEPYSWQTPQSTMDFDAIAVFFNAYEHLTPEEKATTRIEFRSTNYDPPPEITASITAGYPTVTAEFRLDELPVDIEFGLNIVSGFPTVTSQFEIADVPDDITFTDTTIVSGFPTVSANFENAGVYSLSFEPTMAGYPTVAVHLFERRIYQGPPEHGTSLSLNRNRQRVTIMLRAFDPKVRDQSIMPVSEWEIQCSHTPLTSGASGRDPFAGGTRDFNTHTFYVPIDVLHIDERMLKREQVSFRIGNDRSFVARRMSNWGPFYEIEATRKNV